VGLGGEAREGRFVEYIQADILIKRIEELLIM
jgi:hypothetical protein